MRTEEEVKDARIALVSEIRDYFYNTVESYTLNSSWPGSFSKNESFLKDGYSEAGVYCGRGAAAKMEILPADVRATLLSSLEHDWAWGWKEFAWQREQGGKEPHLDPGDGSDYRKACAARDAACDSLADDDDALERFKEDLWEFMDGWFDDEPYAFMLHIEAEDYGDGSTEFRIAWNPDGDVFPCTSEQTLKEFTMGNEELCAMNDRLAREPRIMERFVDRLYDEIAAESNPKDAPKPKAPRP